jgi:hypothetical protein
MSATETAARWDFKITAGRSDDVRLYSDARAETPLRPVRYDQSG